MNPGSRTVLPKSVPPSSISSVKNLIRANDTRVCDLHDRVFQNIGTFVKPAFHKNPVPTGFACIDDHGPEYIPDVNTDIPLSISTKNVPVNETTSTLSPLSNNLSSSPSSTQSSSLLSSQPLPLETQRVPRSEMQHAPRSSSALSNRNGSTPPILTALENY
jgi:hypothetical protein